MKIDAPESAKRELPGKKVMIPLAAKVADVPETLSEALAPKLSPACSPDMVARVPSKMRSSLSQLILRTVALPEN